MPGEYSEQPLFLSILYTPLPSKSTRRVGPKDVRLMHGPGIGQTLPEGSAVTIEFYPPLRSNPPGGLKVARDALLRRDLLTS